MLKIRLKYFALVTSLIIFSASAFSGTESSEDENEKKPKVNLRQFYSVPQKGMTPQEQQPGHDAADRKKTQEDLGLAYRKKNIESENAAIRKEIGLDTLEGFTTEDSKDPGNELPPEDHPRKVEKKESEETIEKWMKKLVRKIQNRDRFGLKLLLEKNLKLANLIIRGDGRTLLMVAMEQDQPDIEIIRELLPHFDLADVPGHSGYNYLSYYEEYKPGLLDGIPEIVELLMQHMPAQEQSTQNPSRKVLKKKSEETMEKWMKKLLLAIQIRNHALVSTLVSRHHDWANEIIPGDEHGMTVLMFAMRQQPPSIEVIRELLNLHFDLTFVPGHPGYDYIRYFESFNPEILAQEGMQEIIKLLMFHEWQDKDGDYISLNILHSNPIYMSLHSSTQSFSHESTAAEEGHVKEKKKHSLKLRLSDATSSLKSSSSSGTTSRSASLLSTSSSGTGSRTSFLVSSSSSGSATSRSSRTNDSGSSRTPHSTTKPNNNSPKPATNTDDHVIQENSTTATTTTVQLDETPSTLNGIVNQIIKTLSKSSSKKKRRASAAVIETKSI